MADITHADDKKEYTKPTLAVIGRITQLTGSYKNLDMLDNNTLLAWQS